MYKNFYHLKENPFSITADPDFYFSSAKHNEAFSHLLYGIQQRKGIIVFTGEIGAGKTTLCRSLLNKIDSKTKTALILNPSFSDLQLLKMILKDLGLEENYKNKFDIITALNEFLIQEASKGHNIAIIIDEAQNLKPRQLEQIRMLSNLETEKQKLLQIVLVGQPELKKVLAVPELIQLNQRISVRYHLHPLDKTDVKEYIYHRIHVASEDKVSEKIKFTEEAIDRIYEDSKGTPRLINIICDRALLAGFTKETFTIDESAVSAAFAEVQ